MGALENPVLVEVTRGGRVESRHRGAVVAVDGDGRTVLSLGAHDEPVYPRSAVKAIQCLPFLESGAADAYGFGDRELALACASHSGEREHSELALSMLVKAGLDATALECGAHWPIDLEAGRDLAREGRTPSPLHNNCSGKHAGFICTCRHRGIDPRGYVRSDHAAQEAVRRAMEEVTGAAHDERNRAIDGCAIPTYAVPLGALARGFARMATGAGLGQERAAAARRILSACMAEPHLVAGTGRADTRLMSVGRGRLFVKTGAEGVYCAALPELGIGIALKCDDGAGRAAEVAVAAVLARLVEDEELSRELAPLVEPPLTNWNGTEVGALRPAEVLRPKD